MTMTQYRAKFQPGDSLFFLLTLLHYFRFSQNVLQGLEAWQEEKQHWVPHGFQRLHRHKDSKPPIVWVSKTRKYSLKFPLSNLHPPGAINSEHFFLRTERFLLDFNGPCRALGPHSHYRLLFASQRAAKLYSICRSTYIWINLSHLA